MPGLVPAMSKRLTRSKENGAGNFPRRFFVCVVKKA
jgi:hypothetical protein